MTGVWVLAAALLMLPAGWFLIGRPLAGRWGSRWWGKEHGRRAALRELRAPEAAAGIWPGGTGWMLLIRIAAGAGGLWLLWPAEAAQGGWAAALLWLLAVWLLLSPVRDYAVLHASVRSGRGAAGGLAGLMGGQLIWRLLLLLGWSFCVLALAALSGRAADAFCAAGLPGTAALSAPAGASAATAAILISCEAISLGVVLQYAGLRRGVRSLLSAGLLAAALLAGLICPITLPAGLLRLLVLASAFCAAAAPSWVLTRPRAALCGRLLLFCLAAGLLAAGLAAWPVTGPALLRPAAAALPAFAPQGFWVLLFAAGGGAAAGLQTVAAGCTANNLLQPEDFGPGAHPAPRQERAVLAVGFGGMLVIGLLAAAALALRCLGPAGMAQGAAGYAGALAALFARLRLPAGPAAVLFYMAAAAPALCVLDVAAAAGRSALQGFFGSASLPGQKLAPWRKLLRSRPMASLLTVLPALLLTGSADAFLPLLDGLGWLLSGLALLLALAAHRRAGRKTGWICPLAAALLCAGWLCLARCVALALQNGAPATAAAAGGLGLVGLLAAVQGARLLWQGQSPKKPARKALDGAAKDAGE